MTVWRYVPKAVVDRYERRYGVKPPGYRATGRVEWFEAWHPDEAPCCKCGVSTDRWVIGRMVIRNVEWAGATYKGNAFCAETHYAFCWPCERRAAIATLRKRAPLNVESEVAYLAALVAEELERAA